LFGGRGLEVDDGQVDLLQAALGERGRRMGAGVQVDQQPHIARAEVGPVSLSLGIGAGAETTWHDPGEPRHNR